MRKSTVLVGRIGEGLSLGAFGLGLAGALSAGVDPFVAVLRAGCLSVALLLLFVAVCRSLAPLMDLASGGESAEPAAGDSGDVGASGEGLPAFGGPA